METRETYRQRIESAEKLVSKYMGWSAAAGFIPLPLVDLGAISLVQLRMLEEISKLYPEVKFKKSTAKEIIGALIGGSGTVLLAAPAASVVKVVPVIGGLIGALTEPAIASAFTYALGRIFIQHFEAGGTLLDINPEEHRKNLDEQIEAAKSGARPGTAAPKPA